MTYIQCHQTLEHLKRLRCSIVWRHGMYVKKNAQVCVFQRSGKKGERLKKRLEKTRKETRKEGEHLDWKPLEGDKLMRRYVLTLLTWEWVQQSVWSGATDLLNIRTSHLSPFKCVSAPMYQRSGVTVLVVRNTSWNRILEKLSIPNEEGKSDALGKKKRHKVWDVFSCVSAYLWRFSSQVWCLNTSPLARSSFHTHTVVKCLQCHVCTYYL